MNGINVINNQYNNGNSPVIAWVGSADSAYFEVEPGCPCRLAFPGFVGPKANGAHMAVAASTGEATAPLFQEAQM